jgi:serine/threonine protein kinase/tetratricopeptide (TPR) repeat protein
MRDNKEKIVESIANDSPAQFVQLEPSLITMVNDFGETEIVNSQENDATMSWDKTPSMNPTQPAHTTRPFYGKYRLNRVLGQGAFGTVYLAQDTQLDRTVAVKVPVITASSPEEAAQQRDKFLIEARNLARLSYPGIVKVLDMAVERDQCYIVSEFLDGPDLKKWLKENSVNWQQSLEIVAHIADALAYAHSQSTVHRDLKPGNVILTQRAEGWRPVIVDFGLAISDSPGATSSRGLVSGTPNYMSPEQAQGFGHRIDGRTDIFALGVILYRMLCGELPFAGDNVMEVLRKVVATDPIPPRRHNREIPEDLEAICLKAMSKDVTQRYTTAGDMAAELRKTLARHEAKAHSASGAERQVATPKQATRRQVTVLNCNCDLFDSEEFLESFSAEDQHLVFREYMRVCRDAVAKFDGTLVQLTGQALLVCFGYPTAFEDAARRAVQTGLLLLEEIAALRERMPQAHEWNFGVRIGVHTGAAVLQDADAAEGAPPSMMGEARTVAIRMESVTPNDTLVVTEATQRLVRGFFEFASLGKSRITGAAEPLETFIVRGESQARTRMDVGEQETLTPLVGRDEEMALLVDLWDAATDASGQIVCVIGEAGLGKSRLVREIREHVLHEIGDKPTMLYEWRCSPFFQNTALHPATERLETELQFHNEPSMAKRLDLLVKYLEEHELAQPDTVWLLANLLSVPTDERFPPLPLSPQRQKEKTLEALLRLLRQYASKRSVLFVVEDLHWVDATTLELLGMLVDQGINNCILTLLTFRPEFETPWGSRVYQTQIALNRLTRQEVASMICQRVGLTDVADEVVDRIIERTEGVPLFVEEFCSALVEANAFVMVDGRMRLSKEFNIAAIPATLKDLLISRLDRLDIRSDLVLLGATIGREFTYKMIQAITGMSEDALKRELDRMVSAEIVYREGTPPQALYTFKHALIQDAAYDSLLTESRQANHLNIANILESDFPETKESTPEVLAHHFTKAGQTQQGIHYWMQAGQRAQGKSANNEAISHFTDGLNLVPKVSEEQEREKLEMGFRLSLIAVLMGARGYAAPEIEPHHKRVQELGLKSEDPTIVGRLLLPYWQWVFINGDHQKSIETTDSLLENAAQTNDAGLLTEAHWSSGCAKYFLGRFSETIQHEEKALSTYHLETAIEHAKVSYQNSGPLAYAFMSKALWAMGKIDKSMDAMNEALRRASELPEPFSLVVVNWNSADLGALMRNAERSTEYAEKVIQACQELGFPFFLGMGTCTSGNAMLLREEYETAAQTIQRGIKTMIATGADIMLPAFYSYLSEANWKLRRHDDANRALEQAFARLEQGERFYEAEMLRIRGEYALDSGDPTAARRFFDQSLAVAQRQQASSFALRTTLSLAKQFKAEGCGPEARKILLAAVSQVEGGDNTPDVVAARQLLATLP